MDVLLVVVENQCPAVRQLSAQRDAVPTGKLQKHFLAQLPKVAGDDEVKILRGGLHVVKMGFDGGIGGGSHGRAHVVCILDAKVGNGADGTADDSGAMAVTAHQCSPGTGDCPLGGGGSLPAVAQRKAVLPLRGGKMG